MSVLDIIKIQRYSFYKLIILMSSTFFLVITMYNISLGFTNEYKNGYERRIEINRKSDLVNQVKLIKYSNVEVLKSYFSPGSISYMNEINAVIGVENAGYPVNVIMSGENLDIFSGLNILRGTFFSSAQYEYGNKVAVISETMAQKLFTTHNIIGNEINILGIKYKIIGLYQNKNSIFSMFASNGIERVYIPFQSSDTQTVKTVFIKDKDLQDEPFKVYKLESILRERIKVNTDFYKINDFYDSTIFIAQPLSAFIFLVGILSIGMMLKYFTKHIQFGVLWLNSRMKSKYFFEILIKFKMRILLYFIVASLILISIGAVFWIVRFKGVIPYKYIPVDNIFDFEFYTDKVKEVIFQANGDMAYVPTQLEVIFRNNLIFTYVLTLFLIINFISLISAIKLNKMVSESIAKQMVSVVVSLFIGLAVSFAFCLVCGIQIVFPAREVVVLVLFYSVKFINEEKVSVMANKLSKSVPD